MAHIHRVLATGAPLLQAVALLEEQFSIEIEVVALERLQRVRDVVELIADALPEE